MTHDWYGNPYSQWSLKTKLIKNDHFAKTLSIGKPYFTFVCSQKGSDTLIENNKCVAVESRSNSEYFENSEYR